jgi:hypothetical protein
MNGENNMPKLDGKKYSYDKEGKSKYLKALKKKRKSKKKPKREIYNVGNSRYMQDEY